MFLAAPVCAGGRERFRSCGVRARAIGAPAAASAYLGLLSVGLVAGVLVAGTFACEQRHTQAGSGGSEPGECCAPGCGHPIQRHGWLRT